MQGTILAVTATLLAVAVLLNLLQWYLARGRDDAWRVRVREADDARHAQELRSAQQIDALLERVHTAPRLDLNQGSTSVEIDPDERPYFADDEDPVEQARWNEFRGEAAESESSW